LEREFGISRLDGYLISYLGGIYVKIIFGNLGKIAIIRYGKIYRGDKVQHAQQRGAAGVIMFSDPMEVAWDGMNSGKKDKVAFLKFPRF
jgi:hypothetical protein